MHTSKSTILSRSIGLGLATFTTVAAIVLGPAASVTLNSFYCLSIYGVIQIAILSYSPVPGACRRVSASPVQTADVASTAIRPAADATRPSARKATTPVGAALAATH